MANPTRRHVTDAVEVSQGSDDTEELGFRLPAQDANTPAKIIKTSSVTDCAKRDILSGILASTQQTVAAQTHLSAQEPERPYPPTASRAGS